MNKVISRVLWIIVLVFLQVFILNRIHWFGVATPFLYIYLILTMDHDTPRNALLLWGFTLGLIVDIFSNTFGVHAAATTLIAFLRPGLVRLFFLRDDNDYYEPGIQAMGFGAFLPYALIATLIHHAVVFILEFFSFEHPLQLLLHIGCSVLLTLFFVFALELIHSRKL